MKFPGHINMNKDWRFALTSEPGVWLNEYDDSNFAAIDIPHDWQIGMTRDPNMHMGGSQGFYPRNHVGVYRKRFFAPEKWHGKALRLVFDGCQRFYEVYLNGVKIGAKKYGYVPYVCELSSHICIGEENLLCVRVDNSDTLGDRWYSGAGLYRGVRLLIDEAVHIVPFGAKFEYELTDGAADVTIDVTLENRTCIEKQLRVKARLTDLNGAMVSEGECQIALAQGKASKSVSMLVPDCNLWDIDGPALYALEVVLMDGEKEIDCVNERVGFRSIVFDGDRGFFLNGKMRKLYGVNLHHDGGACFGAAVPEGVWRRRLEQLKEMGCNAIRCSHNPHAEELYDLCDEMGFVVIDELYDKWYDTRLYFDRLFTDDRMEDLTAMVLRDRNHPSVILWSVGNEVEVQYTEGFYTHLGELCETCRKLDPARPVSLALIGFCIKDYDDSAPLEKRVEAAVRYGEIVDVFMGNYMEGFYRAIRKAGMNKPIIGSEVFSYYRNSENTSLAVFPVSPYNDVKDLDYVIGGFVWAGVDYLGESCGWPSKGWTGCPIDSTGFRKLRAWHLQCQFKEQPMVKIGVFDENDPWDMATANWSFPQMSGHWNFDKPGRMMHVAVMTNCEQVHLYLNEEYVRIARTNGADYMAHFYVPYRRGKLRAVGLLGGAPVAEETLLSSEGPMSIALSCKEIPGTKGHEVAHVDALLLDEHGQIYTKLRPEVRFFVEGDATLAGVDNGDFLAEADVRSGRCPFHLGHALAVIKPVAKSGECVVHACCMDMTAEIHISFGV